MNAPSPHIRLRDEAGQGPAVVILQPAGQPVSKIVPDLARDYRVLTVEVGATAASPGAAQELAAALAHIVPEPAGVIAGNATAPLALWLAAEKPDAVAALGLIAPPPLDAALREKAAAIATATLVLFGTRDAANPPTAGRAFRLALPNCQMLFVYDATGAMAEERPQAVAAALDEFLQRREKFIVTTRSGQLYP